MKLNLVQLHLKKIVTMLSQNQYLIVLKKVVTILSIIILLNYLLTQLSASLVGW